MGLFKSKRLVERKRGLKRINEINDNPSDTYLIHYSCESFFNTNGRTPRIVSISLMNFDNSQTETFSIHLEAQFKKYDFNNLTEPEFDICEKSMLDSYYDFLKKNTTKRYVHWTMINSNFGFKAIDNRYKILGGIPTEIEHKFKIDLGETLCLIYGYGYEKDKDGGRLYNLSIRNKINILNFLKGSLEAEAFNDKKWLELHNSTLVKTKVFRNIINLVNNNKFKTKTNCFKIYGISLESFSEIINNHILLKIIWWFVILLLGFFLKDLYGVIKGN
jgi:hypothetical protein